MTTAAAVPALRVTWRRSTEHFAEQVKRFLRLTVVAALPSAVNLIVGGKFDYVTLFAFIAPFAEVAYREVFPALGAAAADAAPGVTIVPGQVGISPPSTAPSSYTISAPTITAPATPAADTMPDPDSADPGVQPPDQP